MPRIARPLVMAGLSMGLAASLVFVAPLGALADTAGPLFPNATNAADYALTVRGMDIYAAQSPAAQAAWSPELARVAAKNANIYRAAQVYGTFKPEELAQVIPMNGPVDASLHGKLASGMTVTNGAKTWVGKGFRFPSFSSGVWSGVRAVGGVFALTAAMYGFEHRADIANGVVSWIGQDATGVVCSDPVAGGHNPINWITGQDCEQWKAGIAFNANQDVTKGGISSGRQCYAADSSRCVWVSGTGVWDNGAQYSEAWGPRGYMMPLTCFLSTGGGGYPYRVQTADGQVLAVTSNQGPGWGGFATNGCTENAAEQNLAWPGSAPQPASPITGFQLEATSPVMPVTTPESDPPRVIRCTQYGASGNVTNGYTPSFRQSELVGKNAPEPVCVPLPNGENQIRMVVTQIDPDGETVLSDKSETAASSDFRSKYGTDCGTSATQRTCLLDVVQIGNGISCFSATATCTDWFHDPQRDTKYQCNYGGKNEPVQQCAVLANTFDPAKRAAGNPYANPLTGKDTFSGTGSDADTMTMGNPAGSVIAPNGEVTSCWGGNSPGEFNPISWIVRGGQCLLNWAFVPRPAVVVMQTEGVKLRFESSAPGKLATALSTFQFTSPGTGCGGVPVPVPIPDSSGHIKYVTRSLLAACPGDFFAPYAPPFSAFIGGSSCVAGFFGCRRILACVFGFGGAS